MTTSSNMHEEHRGSSYCHENGIMEDGLEPIAIIGFSARLPQDATCPAAFWNLLQEGRSAMTEVPSDRFNIDSFYHTDGERLDTLNVRGGHFLQGDISKFDAPFFSISRTEAESLDPQQRGLLECTYHVLENAGVPMERAAGTKTGVFVGCFAKEYDTIFSRDPELPPKYQASGTGSAMLSNRLSWFYDFKGPSMTLDTACSSSLNALHLACQSLRAGESSMALVAGCNVMLNPDTIMMSLSNLQFLSPDGLCYSFDHRANGYSRGEGFGAVLIKPLSKALQDGDTIRAVIRASGSNQDGRTPGLTQPGEDAQADLIRDTYRRGKLDLDTTRFFEAHGTGTQIGDTTEAAAIHRVFQDVRDSEDPLIIGALKSNIGHLEGASGLASIIKTVMVLESGNIPPNTNFEKPNPKIPVDEWGIKFPLQNIPWPTDGLRRASVNSFGYGGSNAHVVLDDAYHYLKMRHMIGRHRTIPSLNKRSAMSPTFRDSRCVDAYPSPKSYNGQLANGQYAQSEDQMHDLSYSTTEAQQSRSKRAFSEDQNIHHEAPRKSSRYATRNQVHIDEVNSSVSSSELTQAKLLVWSAADEGGIDRSMQTMQNHIAKLTENNQDVSATYLDDLAYTLALKRSRLPWKAYTVVTGNLDMTVDLPGACSKPIRSSGTAPELTFVFTGQGAAWYGMGRELLADSLFMSSLETSDRMLKDLGCSWSLIEELQRDKGCSRISEPEISQPACTALQIALVVLLQQYNIRPIVVVGHSSGEIAAAFCAGALSQRDAIRIAYYRGTLSAKLYADRSRKQETMMAVGLSRTQVEVYMARIVDKGMLSVACINSPVNVTISGDVTAIEALRRDLEQDGVFARKLNIDVAYHSPTMHCVAAEYLSLLNCLDGPLSAYDDHPRPQMISSVSGESVSVARLASGQYWVDNMISKVDFARAISSVQHLKTVSASKLVVEIGPTGALRRPVLDSWNDVEYHSILKSGCSALDTIMELCGSLWCHNVPVDLEAVNNQIDKEPAMLTDLPCYAFNHSHSFWYESRLSKNFRFRKHPRHELLGTQVMDWNPLEAKWRNVIDANHSPWIKDHGFNGSSLYPAAGMIVMAIEASRQLALKPSASIQGYRVKDVTFSRALVIPENNEIVEAEFYLHCNEKDQLAATSQWNEFRLCSLSDDQWVEHCRGSIMIEYEQDSTEAEDNSEREKLRHQQTETHGQIAEACTTRVGSKQMYHNLGAFGFDFGPTFQTLHEVAFSESGEATAILELNAWKSRVPDRVAHIQKYVIHPTDLDGLLHLTVTAITRGGWKAIPTMVPTYMHELWISNKFLNVGKISSLTMSSKSTSAGLREAEFTMVACDAASNEVLITIDQYRATAISSLGMLSKPSPWRRLCFQPTWKLDIDTAGTKAVSAYCNDMAGALSNLAPNASEEAELACCLFMTITVAVLDLEENGARNAHLQKYLEWMKLYLSGPEAQRLKQSANWQQLQENSLDRQEFLTRLENSGPEGKVYVTVGKLLPSILRGEIDVIDLLFNNNLLQDFYSGDAFMSNYEKMRAYVDLLAHKNPNMRVLEIGAGTGGATQAVLRALGPQDRNDIHSTPRFHEYIYTDISAGFFEAAKARFSRDASRLSFRTLDIEHDPVKQGFEAEKYDLVVASCVLHATGEINTTLKHTKSLLKPGGKLLLFEPCRLECARIPFVFGLLEGWWLSKEPTREWSPLLSDTTWHDTLRDNGFSGTDICLRDEEDNKHTFSVMVSTASHAPIPRATTMPQRLLITVDPSSHAQVKIAYGLKDLVQAQRWPEPTVASFTDLIRSDLEGATCISLLEIDGPFLDRISAKEFSVLKTAVQKFSSMIWVSNEGSGPSRHPSMGTITGFGRSMCSENENLNFTTLLVEGSWNPSSIVSNICSLVFDPNATSREQEYRTIDSHLHINRITELNSLNDHINRSTVVQEVEQRPFGQEPKRALTLTTSSPGLLSSLQFIDDPVTDPLGPEDVEVEVKAVGINFKNVMVALGQIPDTSLGQECSGIVTRVGDAVPPTRLSVGDRVCCLARDGFKTFARPHISSTYMIPDSMTFATAAAVPVAFCTAYYSLVHLARIMPGESVLIHAAAGGVGQAAIQIARHHGAEIYVTVGSEAKKKLLMELYNIPEDHIFSSRHASFALGVKRMTSGRGVDVVLNSLSGELLKLSVECVAPLGRFVEIGKKDMYLRNEMSMTPFLNNIAFFSVDLGIIADKARPLMQEIISKAMGMFSDEKNGMVVPQPLTSFPVSRVEEAFRFLQSGKNSGKAVVEIGVDDIVPTVPSTKPSWSFSPDATYVIAGGTGGLGRSIARWMIARGARYIILLSRSGTKAKAALDLVNDLSVDGKVVVAPSCDITDVDALKTVIAQVSANMPPIRGCIQGSMVLRDGLFNNMTHSNFHAALAPKVQGTWNLHNILPTGMDFFVLLSSTGGVFGSRGQSNYAAGSTFQDAFARFRVSQGEKCLSLDLGLMLAVGFAAEHQDITDSLRGAGYEGIHEAEFHAMLDHCCDPNLPLLPPDNTQIITGIATPESLASKGIDEIFWMSKPIFTGLRQMDRIFTSSSSPTSRQKGKDYKFLLEQAQTLEEKADVLADALRTKLSAALSMPVADIETEKPTYAYGVDSLVAVEIRYWFLKEFEKQVTVFEILGSKSIRELCGVVAGRT